MTYSSDEQRANISGVWNLTLAAPTGKQSVRVEIARGDNCYIGTATQGSETVALCDLSVKGNCASWNQRIKRPFPMSISFDLLFMENEVSGICNPGIFPKVKVTGSRE